MEVTSQGCWRETGVYGDRSCTRLQEVIHCRNCPVYSSTGVQLLDRPLPKEYRETWASHFAIKTKAQESKTASAIVFRIKNEWLAVPTRALQEVTERRPMHSLPHRRQGMVVGLVNVRGELLTAISLGAVLGIQGVPTPKALRLNCQRLLVAGWNGQRFAFPVDEVQGPLRFHPSELEPLAAYPVSGVVCFTPSIFRWQGKSVGCLDCEALFSTLSQALA